MKKYIPFAFLLVIFISSCSNEGGGTKTYTTPVTPPPPRVHGPVFSGDSAYSFVKKQVDFGPRIPGTKAHEACADYFVNKLKSYGWSVNVQTAQATLPLNQTMITIKNIVASYKPELKERILLLAHWDTRPFADQDHDSSLAKKPFDGADDGGSGA